MFSNARSVYQRVLGAAFDDLHPTLQRYFGPLPPHERGVGEGVYEVAGSRHRWLTPVFLVMAQRRVLFPEYARGVPFDVVNRTSDGELRAVRSFRFAGRTRRMEDVIAVRNGVLVDRLGRRGGLEVAFEVEVRVGMLRLASTTLALRVGRARVALPRFARVVVTERVDPLDDRRQRVDVRIRMPLLGEVFRYAGAFAYRIEDADAPWSQAPGDVGARP